MIPAVDDICSTTEGPRTGHGCSYTIAVSCCITRRYLGMYMGDKIRRETMD